MISFIKIIILLGYLNWFYAIGYCLFQIIKGRRNRRFIIRAILTLIIPWFGGIVFWVFPYIASIFQKKAEVKE